MERYSKRDLVVITRFSEQEKTNLDACAARLGMTANALLHTLACIPVDAECRVGSSISNPPTFIAFNKPSILRLSQAVHAYASLCVQSLKSLNSIAESNKGLARFHAACSQVSLTLETVNAGTILLERDVQRIEQSAASFFDSDASRRQSSLSWNEWKSVRVGTRFSEAEKRALDENAKSIGTTTSSLIRVLARISGDFVDDGGKLSVPERMFIDSESIPRLTRSVNTYGSLYNQATKSLNTLAKHGARNTDSLIGILDHVSVSFEGVASGILEIRNDAQRILRHELVYFETADGRSAQW